MRSPLPSRQEILLLFLGVLACAGPACAQAAPGHRTPEVVRIVELEGTVEISPQGATTWVSTQTTNVLNPGDRVRTGPSGRALLGWSGTSTVRLGPGALVEILPPHTPQAQSGLHLFRGLMSFFHRDKPGGRLRVISPGADAIIDGTEFVLSVEPVTERTTLYLIDGKVSFTNQFRALHLTNNQQAIAEPGKPPEPGPGFIVNNVLQWAFYYPAVLDLGELPLTPQEAQVLNLSLVAYRAGDLMTALAHYPDGRPPGSDAERVYHAALLLAVGQVRETEADLAALPAGDPTDRLHRLANALRILIAAIKREPAPATPDPQLSTEFLAGSYFEQSRSLGDPSLKRALSLARQAANRSPEFGFAWERVAELEFSFGQTSSALEALNRSLSLSPSNAQALALKGFLLAAQDKTREAMQWFNRAIDTDSSLANAWLGRGLCKIRLTPDFFSLELGTRNPEPETTGIEDLLIAASLEPQRALLRSYLGKAYGQAGDARGAFHELDLAKSLDPNDPTPWLYSALLNRDENRINEGVGDLERSIALNDNRALFRSRLLLDEDRAVRGANLARIYREAGMVEVSWSEAARATSYDYANYSAHLFLSESFNALRDPTRFNLRFEAAWLNELLLANLLSPIGGTPLSQLVSQQEYSQFFNQNRIGLSSDTQYRSDGQIRELASQFGWMGNTSWALDLDYQHNDGVRPNNELDRLEWTTTVKQQLTPRDSVMLLATYEDYHSGDNFQYYDPFSSDPTRHFRPQFRFDEYQQPIALGGYDHAWAPGVHTLFLGGRLENEQRVSDQSTPQILFTETSNGQIVGQVPGSFDVDYHSQLEVYTAELNQIFQGKGLTLSIGGRVQSGSLDTHANLTNPSGFPFGNPTNTVSNENLERFTGYGYLTVEPVDRLWLTAGLAYDDITYPRNFRNPPLSTGEDHRSQLGPKAAAVWSPVNEVAFRGAFSRFLGGVSIDENYRLEPAQLAGFPQVFRTLIPESVAGSVSAPECDTFGLALDLKFPSRTYVGLQAERLESCVRRSIGVFSLENGLPDFVPESVSEKLDYCEQSLALNLSQLIGDSVVLGASYRFVHAELHDVLSGVPVSAVPQADQTLDADLQHARGFILFNHSSGFFSRAEAHWYHQHNTGYSPALPGDDFFQENLFVGYRFPRQRADITLGVLNLTDQDYRLNPLTVYDEVPRERTFLARLRVHF